MARGGGGVGGGGLEPGADPREATRLLQLAGARPNDGGHRRQELLRSHRTGSVRLSTCAPP